MKMARVIVAFAMVATLAVGFVSLASAATISPNVQLCGGDPTCKPVY